MSDAIVARLQAEVGPDQIASARLLPAAGAEDEAKAREEVAAPE